MHKGCVRVAGDEYGFRNPAEGVKPLREPRPTLDPLSVEEVQQLLEVHGSVMKKISR